MSGIDTISITLWESDKERENVTYRRALRVSSDSGPSPCISKWSDGGNHRVPKPRKGKGGEH